MKVRTVMVYLCSVLWLAGCDKGPGKASTESSEDRLIRMAKEAVTKNLKDPSSADFRNVRWVSGGDVCGEVNAKNSFGGYAGFQRFSWTIIVPDHVDYLSDSSTKCR